MKKISLLTLGIALCSVLPFLASAKSTETFCDRALSKGFVLLGDLKLTCNKLENTVEANRKVLAVCQENNVPVAGEYTAEIYESTNSDFGVGQYIRFSQFGISPDTAPAERFTMKCY